MDYLMYTAFVVTIVLFLFGMLVGAEEKKEATPHEAPAEEVPELAPDIYAGALAYLLIDAELRGLEQVQRNGGDESGKGAKV